MIKEEFHFINSIVNNNTFLVMAKEDSIAYWTKQSNHY